MYNSDLKQYKDIINKFINICEKNNINLDNFYENLKTLKIISSDELLYKTRKDKNTIGMYIIEDNTILLETQFTNSTLLHELLHVASTKQLENINKSIIGLVLLIDKKLIIKLNEGYTDVLNSRLFSSNIGRTDYKYSRSLSILFEKIIGQDIMYDWYFNSNWYNFRDEMLQYITISELKELLKLVDVAEKHKKVSKILFKAYLIKLNKNFKNEKININNYIDELENFLYVLGIKRVGDNKELLSYYKKVMKELVKLKKENNEDNNKIQKFKCYKKEFFISRNKLKLENKIKKLIK